MQARIDTHEKVCAERYGALRESVKRIEMIIWFFCASIISGMGYLVLHTIK